MGETAGPNPMGLATLWMLGLIAHSREEACLAVELISGAKCARKAGHGPLPHAGMWQGGDVDSWTVTVWPVLD